MQSERRREVLESIVHSRDPTVSASDRLRALELLHELERTGTVRDEIERETRDMPTDELDARLDEIRAALVAALLAADEQTVAKFPATASVIRHELDARVRAAVAAHVREMMPEPPQSLPLRIAAG